LGSHTIRAHYSGSKVFAPNTAQLYERITQVTFSPARLYFGHQAVGTTSAPQTITMTNTSSTLLSLGKPSVTGNFSIQGTTCGTSLAGGASCTVTILFHPSVTGKQYGHLGVYYNGAGSPQRVKVSGAGV